MFHDFLEFRPFSFDTESRFWSVFQENQFSSFFGFGPGPAGPGQRFTFSQENFQGRSGPGTAPARIRRFLSAPQKNDLARAKSVTSGGRGAPWCKSLRHGPGQEAGPAWLGRGTPRTAGLGTPLFATFFANPHFAHGFCMFSVSRRVARTASRSGPGPTLGRKKFMKKFRASLALLNLFQDPFFP